MNCECMRNTGVFCPFDFRNDFRGHSRDSKRAIIDYIFHQSRGGKMKSHRCMPLSRLTYMVLSLCCAVLPFALYG